MVRILLPFCVGPVDPVTEMYHQVCRSRVSDFTWAWHAVHRYKRAHRLDVCPLELEEVRDPCCPCLLCLRPGSEHVHHMQHNWYWMSLFEYCVGMPVG